MNRTEQMIPKLNEAYYAVRSVAHISDINTLKSIDCAYFHSVILFQQWEYFHFTKENYQNYGWCTTQNLMHSLFKQLEIQPLPCMYILSLMSFIINKQENFKTNSSKHNINTRNKHHLHRLNANLSCFQRSTELLA